MTAAARLEKTTNIQLREVKWQENKNNDKERRKERKHHLIQLEPDTTRRILAAAAHEKIASGLH